MANAVEKAVLELTEELAEKQGVYVVDVSYKKENGERWGVHEFYLPVQKADM